MTQIKTRFSEVFTTLEILKLDVQSAKRTGSDINQVLTSGFLQLDSYFMKMNSHLVEIDEYLDPLSQTLSSEIRSSILTFKEFEDKLEKLRIEDKKEVIHSISQNNAIDAGLDINTILKTHIGELKKELVLSLFEQFISHKKLLK